MREQPLKIENLQSSQESKEKKKKTLEMKIGDNTYMIETESYDFEYPKNIQQETGIIGYERTKINSASLYNIIYDISLKKGIDLKEKGINSITDIKMHTKNGEKRVVPSEITPLIIEICYDILSQLSNKQYPTNTVNHMLSAYTSDDAKKIHKQDFKADKFFLQKIFDIDLLEKSQKRNAQAFNFHNSNIKLDVFDKKTSQFKERIEFHEIKKYSNELQNDKVLVNTNDGLNNFSGDFWLGQIDLMSFGFSMDDNLFKEYISKAFNYYVKKQEENPSLMYGKILEHLIAIFTFNKKRFTIPGENISDDDKELLENMRNYIKDTYKDNEYIKIANDLDIQKFIDNRYRIRGTELEIPVLINNDEIPQLQWGHAKYAHFFNEKGFNFIEFKHAEHLPKKVQG